MILHLQFLKTYLNFIENNKTYLQKKYYSANKIRNICMFLINNHNRNSV